MSNHLRALPTTDRRSAAPPDEPALPARLAVSTWADPMIDAVGHDPRSAYVEEFWLGILGPSAVWLLRRLARELEQAPEGCTIDVADVARSIGLAGRNGRQAPITRTIDRLVGFGLAQRISHDQLAVRHRVPPLTRRQLVRLPEHLQLEHQRWQERQAAVPAITQLRERARALALSLLDLGETADATERQLHRWRFHPAVAHDALRWALAEHARRAATAAGHPAAQEPAPSVRPGRLGAPDPDGDDLCSTTLDPAG